MIALRAYSKDLDSQRREAEIVAHPLINLKRMGLKPRVWLLPVRGQGYDGFARWSVTGRRLEIIKAFTFEPLLYASHINLN